VIEFTAPDFATHVVPGPMVEVGVWQGNHAEVMLNHWRPSRLILVDTWIYDPKDSLNESLMGTNAREIRGRYLEVVNRFEPDRRVVVMRMSSIEAAGLFADDSFALVYIDANHDLDHVTADLDAWAPKVRSGGWLCGHDYSLFDSVKMAVDEFTGGAGPEFVFRRTEGDVLSYAIRR